MERNTTMKAYHIIGASLILLLLPALCVMGQVYSSPQKTFEIYKEAAKIGDVKIYLQCITEDSRKMLAGQLPSKEVLQQEYSFLMGKEYAVKETENAAILYFKKNTDYEPPYLFLREKNVWKIDLKAMEEKIFFDENKKWYIVGERFLIPPKESGK